MSGSIHEATLTRYKPGDATHGTPYGKVEELTLNADTGWMPRWSGTATVTGLPMTTPLQNDAPDYLGLKLTRTPVNNSGVPGTSESLELVMLVDTLTRDHERGTVTVELLSCEMILQRLYRMLNSGQSGSTQRYDPINPSTIVQLVRTMIGKVPGVGGTPRLIETPSGSAANTSNRERDGWPWAWSIWDYLEDPLNEAEWALWADNPLEYRLLPQRVRSGAGVNYTLLYTELTRLSEVYDKGEEFDSEATHVNTKLNLADPPPMGDAYVVWFRGGYGVNRARIREVLIPGIAVVGETGSISQFELTRSARKFTVTAPIRTGVRPDSSIGISGITPEPGGPSYRVSSSKVSQMTFRYPDGLMDLTLTDCRVVV